MAPASVREALREAAARFAAAGCLTPRLDAELLLAEALGVRRDALYREPERVLTEPEARRFSGFTERRERREPVAYIIGRRAFRTIELEVGPGALVPRPETETLVEVALAELARLDARLDRELGVGEASRDAAPLDTPARSEAGASGRPAPRVPRLLDVGTGSGAIALAVASEHPGVQAVGVDIDTRALDIAGRNARRLGLTERVELFQSDLFDGLPEGACFDLIVSNPPYLTEDELAGVEREVRVYEPRHALLGGSSGLDVYERLVPGALPFLEPGGLLAVEIHEGRATEVTALFKATGRYAAVTAHDDLGGAPRVVCGRERTRSAAVSAPEPRP